ncbi:alpha/beta fold hydrolase [Micromonospora eburnea]|uniref:Pimeloyl-ACP methyl ester carboxylesterase n=1 Tax=Micromonospora eburnea TaxID=227316 RepID=A0A1C6UAY0_9ACTN|nr:alpha/beta fold hydrolase [Micromonospora eburnea]SCL51245.1 Pimeloyl-ACP methyl ester carboxylesterase [Micromonospora eburnea]
MSVSSTRSKPTRRRRLIIGPAILLVVVGLLLVNALLVERQEAEAAVESTLSLDGGNIHVSQHGPQDAPAIVLIHGLAGSTRWWDPVVPIMAESHRVIRIDLLGHGRSAKPTGPGYGIPEQGRRVGQVLDLLGVKHAVVVGHSTGGSVATALAEQRGDLVTALALINSGPRLDAFLSQGPTGRLMAAPVVGHLLWRLRTDGLLRRAMSTGFSRPGYEIPQQLVDDVRGMTYHAFTATDQAADDYLEQRTLPDRLADLGKPLLVIFGEEDRRWRSSSAADYRTVPGAKVELLAGLGHSPMLEDPPRTAELLLAFAAAHPAREG